MSDTLGIVLVGLPGSGKSAVGRCVADRLGRPFVDLDVEIERRTGRSAAAIIRDEGEEGFRELERDAVAAACCSTGSVIATGGGAVLDPFNRFALMQHGFRVRLDFPLEELARRVAADGLQRPLLGDDPAAGLRRLAAERTSVYAAIDAGIDAGYAGHAGRDPGAVAEEVIRVAGRSGTGSAWRPLLDERFARHHPLGARAGRLLAGAGLDARTVSAALAPFEGRAPAVVADRRALSAAPHLGAALPAGRRRPVSGGEGLKTFTGLRRILAWLASEHVERDDPLIAVGGGTVGDAAGLAAALHRRGIPLVQVPTTWLAQADSALGGKVAIDLPGAKNGAGTFWPAWLVVSDIGLLDTLPLPRRRDGIAEALKTGLAGDPALWRLLERRGREALAGDDPAARYAIVERTARYKLAVVDRDPYEAGERRVLNLGHTAGHALEAESRFRLGHGAAVALGLRAEAQIAALRGAEAGLCERIDATLSGLGFALHRAFDARAIESALMSDKKRSGGRNRWNLPMAVGRTQEVDDVTPRELRLALRAIQR